jgi:hypothetical protein
MPSIIVLNIGGVDMPTPSDYGVGRSDLDGKSRRNTKGKMTRDRITTKTKISVAWEMLTATEASTILTAVDPEFFVVKYIDPKANAILTKTMYSGDKDCKLKATDIGGVLYWKGMAFNMIEQ